MEFQPSAATLASLVDAMAASDLKIEASIKDLGTLRTHERLLALAELLDALAERRDLLAHGLDALGPPSFRPWEA